MQLNPGVVHELVATAAQGLLFPLGVKPRDITAVGPGHNRPLILIHGYGHNRSALLPLETYLRLLGFNRVFPFSYSAQEGIEAVAKKLALFVSKVQKACACENNTVDLVAHSLGGLAARVYLQDLGGARVVDQCLSLATPHLGSANSTWAPPAVGEQIRPESAFIKQLNRPGARAPGVRFCSLWADQDLMIRPRENAIYNQGDDYCLPATGHLGILTHPQSFQHIAQKLSANQEIPPTPLAKTATLARRTWRLGHSLWNRKKNKQET